VITYARELEDVVSRQILPPERASQLEGAERREPFSIFAELRLVAWAGIMMITTGVGIVVKDNLDRIGPLAFAVVLGVAALGALLFVAWRRKQGRSGIIDDYIVLLGALLVSADVGFIEAQFKLFDAHWQRHLLLLAIIHAVIAYLFDSRAVLTLSITALAGWIGVQQPLGALFSARTIDFALRSLACSAAVLAWRQVDLKFRVSRTFQSVFEHFAANFAFGASMALLFDDKTRLIGIALALILATAAFIYAVRSRREAFAIYALIYGVIAADSFVLEMFNDGFIGLLFIVVSTIAAIVALFLIHAHFRSTGDEA
jgi:hypothetical protein